VKHTVDNVANVLETCASNRPFVMVKASGLAMDVEQQDVAERIEDGVDAGCDEGQGQGRNGGVDWREVFM
jgi:hypothetical protein